MTLCMVPHINLYAWVMRWSGKAILSHHAKMVVTRRQIQMTRRRDCQNAAPGEVAKLLSSLSH